jgi:hypothetical protein
LYENDSLLPYFFFYFIPFILTDRQGVECRRFARAALFTKVGKSKLYANPHDAAKYSAAKKRFSADRE